MAVTVRLPTQRQRVEFSDGLEASLEFRFWPGLGADVAEDNWRQDPAVVLDAVTLDDGAVVQLSEEEREALEWDLLERSLEIPEWARYESELDPPD